MAIADRANTMRAEGHFDDHQSLHVITKKEEVYNHTMGDESEEAKLEIAQLKSEYQKLVTSAQHDLEATEDERDRLREAHGVLEKKLKEVETVNKKIVSSAEHDLEETKDERDKLREAYELLEKKLEEMKTLNKSLTDGKIKWVEKVASQQEEMDLLTRELKLLKMDATAHETRMSFDQAELENSRKQVQLLESEVKELREICYKFAESSTTQISDSQGTIDSLKKEKDMAESEVDKMLQRNKNQTNLLQRLEKQFNESKKASEARIQALEETLKQEKAKAVKLAKGGFFSPKNSQRNDTAVSPSRDSGGYASSTKPSPLMSQERSPTRKAQGSDYISLSDMLDEKDSGDDMGNAVRVSAAQAERNNWKAYADDTGEFDNGVPDDRNSQTSAKQSNFIKAVVNKKQQKKGFWENMFGVHDDEIGGSRISLQQEVLSVEIKNTMQEGAMIQRERQKILEERTRAREEEEKKIALENVKQLKTAVKWGLFNVFSQGEEESSEPQNEKGKETRVSDVSTIDLDTLRVLAANRTAGLTEEE